MLEKIRTRNIVRMVYILLLFAVTSSVTFSRYMASISGTDTTNMATFTVTSDIVESTEVAIPYNITTDGETYTYELIITNFEGSQVSDVDLDYTVELDYTENLPLIITLRETEYDPENPDNPDVSDEYEAQEGYGTVSPTDEGATSYNITEASFSHSEKITHVYYIDVTWDTEAENSKDYRLSYEIDLITVTIAAEQNVDVPLEPSNSIGSPIVTY